VCGYLPAPGVLTFNMRASTIHSSPADFDSATPQSKPRQRSRSEHRGDDDPKYSQTITDSPAVAGDKRHRADNVAHHESEDFVSHGELQDFMAEFKAGFLEDQKGVAETQASKAAARMELAMDKTFNKFASALKATETTMDRRSAALEADVAALKSQMANLQTQQTSQVSLASQMAAQLAVAEAATPEAATSATELAEFERAPRPHVLQINASEDIKRESLGEAMVELFRRANLDIAAVKFMGPDSGRFFSLVFQPPGAIGTLGKRANQLYEACRNDGDWIQLQARNASGAPVRIFLDRDRSPRQAKLEAGGRKLFKVLQELQPLAKPRLKLDKRDARISLDGLPLVRAVVLGPRERRLEWNEAQLPASGFLKDEVVAKWEAKKEDTTVWTV